MVKLSCICFVHEITYNIGIKDTLFKDSKYGQETP